MKKFIVIPVVLLSLLLSACAAPATTTESPAETNSDPWAFALDSNLDYLTMVNDDNPYEFGGEYDTALQGDLLNVVTDLSYETCKIERATLIAYTQLKADLQEQGMTIGLLDAYRTADDQQEVYDYYANLEGWAETNRVLKPGESEHHTGLLLNVLVWFNGDDPDADYQWWTETAERQEQYEYFKLLHETLPKYGFIDRYPAGKEDLTGLPCEPYEIRFVGSSEIAEEIQSNNLCLEEYLSNNK